MKLLFQNESTEMGGVEITLAHLFRELKDRVCLSLVCPAGRVRDYLAPHVHEIFEPVSYVPEWIDLLSQARPQLAIGIIRNIVAMGAACRSLGIPSVLLRGFRVAHSPYHRFLTEAALELYEAAIVPSEATARDLRSSRKLRLQVIPNAVDTDCFSPKLREKKGEVRKSLGIDEESYLISYTARLVASKRHADLVEILSKLRAKGLPGRLLLITRTESPESQASWERLQERAHQRGVSGYIHTVCAPPEGVSTFLSAADLFVFPSALEGGNPCAVLEAMAMGLPFLAAESVPASEILSHGSCGRGVPEGNIDAFVDQIRDLHRCPREASAMGAMGRKIALEHYSPQTMAGDYLKFFNELVEAKPGDRG